MQSSFLISMSPAQLDALVTKFLGAGATYADKGILPEQHGVVLGYAINRASEAVEVTFTVIRKPFIASVGMIESQVRKLIGIA